MKNIYNNLILYKYISTVVIVAGKVCVVLFYYVRINVHTNSHKDLYKHRLHIHALCVSTMILCNFTGV